MKGYELSINFITESENILTYQLFGGFTYYDKQQAEWTEMRGKEVQLFHSYLNIEKLD